MRSFLKDVGKKVPVRRHPNRRAFAVRSRLVSCGVVVFAALASHAAQALPSYARQTGQDCAACHVGSYGPQLTPYGVKFKIGGYTDTDGKSGHIPLSAMLLTSFSHTAKNPDQEDAGPTVGNNNVLVAQDAAVFLAGGLTKNLGTFIEAGYSGVDNALAVGEVDVRFAGNLQLGGKDTVLGVSLNNDPTVTDPLNTLPAWRFPYASSDVAPTPAASTLLQGGLSGQVLGLNVYGFWNDSIYAEVGGYGSLTASTIHQLGLGPADEASKLDQIAPYWRLGYLKDNRKSAYSFGIFGMNGKLLLDPSLNAGPTNDLQDIGIDASYQLLGTRKHIFTVSGAYINEQQTLDRSVAQESGLDRTATLNNVSLNGSYTYDETYGLTLGLVDTWGDKNPALYPAEPQTGSRTGSPNSTAWILEADWTPFGKESSWHAPWANLRLGLQYTMYTQFNGSSSNYDGFGRNASDNNTIFTYLWLAL